MDAHRRRWLAHLGSAALLVPGGVCGLIRNVLADERSAPASGVHTVRGAVYVNERPAVPGALIGPGDTVRTGPGAEAIYIINRDAYLQRENTAVGFASEAGKALMRVVTGKILSVFAPGERRIEVSTAALGIRGTACYIEDQPAKETFGGTAPAPADAAADSGLTHSRTYFCLCYGEVDLTPRAAPQQRTVYRTGHHDHPLYIHDDMRMPTMMLEAPVINHSDAELTLLEALVGRRPPFWGREGAY